MILDNALIACTAVSLSIAFATLIHQLIFGDTTVAASVPVPSTSSNKKKKKNATTNISNANNDQHFLTTRRHFLIGYAIMSLGDWLQGPYLFAMYHESGLSNQAMLDLYSFDFALGALLSVAVGFVASSDTSRSKAACLVYGILYGASCICNHFPKFFSVLALGCAVDGLCNALLRSAFEEYWVGSCDRIIKQQRHNNRVGTSIEQDKQEVEQQHQQEQRIAHTLALSQWFSTVCSLIAGIICHGAILAFEKVVGAVVDHSMNKYTATMDLAALVLFVGSGYIWMFWEGAAGGSGGSAAEDLKKKDDGEIKKSKSGDIDKVSTQPPTLFSVLLRRLCQPQALAVFLLELFAEAAMLLVISLYPALVHSTFVSASAISNNNNGKDAPVDVVVPFGLIFAQLMSALALGSYIFSSMLSNRSSNDAAASSSSSFILKFLAAASVVFAGALWILNQIVSSNNNDVVIDVVRRLFGVFFSSDTFRDLDDAAAVITFCVVLACLWAFEIATGVYLAALGGLHEHQQQHQQQNQQDKHNNNKKVQEKEEITSTQVRGTIVGICRMLSYAAAWMALEHRRLFFSSSNSTSVEVAAWQFASFYGQCFASCAVFCWLFC